MRSSCTGGAAIPRVARVLALGVSLFLATLGGRAANANSPDACPCGPRRFGFDRPVPAVYAFTARESRSVMGRVPAPGFSFIGEKFAPRPPSIANAGSSSAIADDAARWPTLTPPWLLASPAWPAATSARSRAIGGPHAMELAFGPGFPIALPPGGGSGGPPYSNQIPPGFGAPTGPKGSQPSPVVELPNEDYYVPVLGLEVRAAVGRVSDQLIVPGLAVVSVAPGTPAAKAGLRALNAEPNRSHEGALTLAAVVIGICFPPALYLWAWSMNDENRVGKACDLIIGIDGERAAHVLDLDEELRAVKPGDVVYLNVLRNGKRAQVPLYLASASARSTIGTSARSKLPAAGASIAPGKTPPK